MKKLLILLTLWSATITANASLISMDIEVKAYGIDDTLTADIYISELNNGFQQLVSEFSFNLLSQDSLLTYQQTRFGNMLDVDFFTFIPSDKLDDNSSLNSLFISEFSFADSFDLLAAQDGHNRFKLASIDFKVTGVGEAEFKFSNVSVLDDFGASHQSVTSQGAIVQLVKRVSVPEPSSIVIFALALLILMSVTKKYEVDSSRT